MIWITSQDEFDKYINFNGNKVLVDFTAPDWCRPCQQFAPHYERASLEADEVTFLAVDVDTNPWAMQDYGIRAVPTVSLYENGEFVRNIKAPQGAIPFINDVRS